MNTATRNKRDELANEYAHNKHVRYCISDERDFKAGFDAGYAIARKEAEVLVESLRAIIEIEESYSMDDKSELQTTCEEALKQYEQGQAE